MRKIERMLSSSGESRVKIKRDDVVGKLAELCIMNLIKRGEVCSMWGDGKFYLAAGLWKIKETK